MTAPTAVRPAGRFAGHGHRGALALYFLLIAAILAPFWLGGEVIAPNRQQAVLGLDVAADAASRIETPQFSDWSTVFVPEVAVHLHGPRSGWLATWSPYNELGRPLYHDAGLSPAWPPTWVLARLTDDPARLYTWHSLLTLLAGGLFAFGLARERGLRPVASLTAALCVSATPVVLAWLTFPLFHSVLAWSCGALYGVGRIVRGRVAAGWSLLAFSIYSLLMTGYAQDVVAHAWLMGVFGTGIFVIAVRENGRTAALRLAGLCASAVAVGALLALPLYLDLLVRAAESSRLDVEPEFFLANLPTVDSREALRAHVAAYFMPAMFGNPVAPGFAWGAGGMSLQPVFMGLALIGAIARFRRVHGWLLGVLVLHVAAYWHPLYRFAIEHLGFDLSRSHPLYTAQIPMMLLAAHGADVLARRWPRGPLPEWRIRAAVAIAVLALLAVAGVSVELAAEREVAIHWRCPLLVLAAAWAFVAATFRRGTWLLPVVLVATVYANGRPLLLTRPPEAIATTSPLVETVRKALPPGGRFAIVGPTPLLPPNTNATLGLPSLHTYNSLSSRRYQAFVTRLGGSTGFHGRHNTAIRADTGDVDFALAGVGVVLSPQPLTDPALESVAEVAGLHVLRVRDFEGGAFRWHDPGLAASDAPRIASLDRADRASVRVVADAGDRLEFAVTPSDAPSLLVTGLAWHPQWVAFARRPAGDVTVRVVPVNDAFAGVALPAGTTGVELRFEPYVRHAWIAHVFFLLLFAALAVARLRRRWRGPSRADDTAHDPRPAPA